LTKTSQVYFEIGKTSPGYVGRWKFLSGSGREALYRALCGVERNSGFCLGHLGDLAYFWPRSVVSGERHEKAKEIREYCEKVGIERCQEALPELRDLSPDEAMTRLREAELLHQAFATSPGCETRAGDPSPHEGWQMVATPLDFKRGRRADINELSVYRGYPDSGYLKTVCKRDAIWGTKSGRRPLTGGAAAIFGPRWIQGQHVVPPCKIGCPVCGEMNAVNWPERLAESQAR
jgi:hypothetical protein